MFKKVFLTQKELESIQSIELEMLKSFIDICNKFKLKYYIIGGTLLGAVRHGGFIPWDDDIDIGMPRKDYEVFLEKGQNYLPCQYFLQSKLSEPNLPINFTKIRNTHTLFAEVSIRKLQINKGVFIDIFPLDWFPDNEKEQKKVRKKIKWLNYCNQKAFYFDKSNPYKKKALIINFITFFCSYKEAVKRKENLYQTIRGTKSIVNYSGAWGEKEIFPVEWFGEGVYLKFEGLTVCCPQKYDLLLHQLYGDYLILPPIEKRVSHHNLDSFNLETERICNE